jgi:ferredoxin
MVSTIEVIITDMFEDSEYSEPARAFKKELIQDSIDSCPVECIHWEE